jgi:hypothetical protein
MNYPCKTVEIEGFEFPQYGSLTPLEAMAIAELSDDFLPQKEKASAFLKYKFGVVTLAMQRIDPNWTDRQTESSYWSHHTEGDRFVTIEVINKIFDWFRTEIEGRRVAAEEESDDPKE